MKSVRINSEKLVGKVRENLELHREEFKEADEGYRKAFKEELEQRLLVLNAGQLPDPLIRLPKPENHEVDYLRVIAMLELSEDDVIELSAIEFAQYVQDEWNWKHTFSETISNYKVA